MDLTEHEGKFGRVAEWNPTGREDEIGEVQSGENGAFGWVVKDSDHESCEKREKVEGRGERRSSGSSERECEGVTDEGEGGRIVGDV